MYFNSPDEILQYTTSRVLAIIPLHILLLFVFTAFILVGIVYLFWLSFQREPWQALTCGSASASASFGRGCWS